MRQQTHSIKTFTRVITHFVIDYRLKLRTVISTVELKSTLGWPSLQACRNYLKCVLVHKCLHGIAPSYLLSEFRHAHLFHGYNTKSCDLLRPPFAKTTKYQGSF